MRTKKGSEPAIGEFSMITLPMYTSKTDSRIPPWWLHSAQHAIKEVGTAHPRLDRVGWNYCFPRRASGQELFSERSVATAIAFIEAGPVTRARIPKKSSYALKHIAERWGRSVGFETYVGNGDFIIAALHCGVTLGEAYMTNCPVALRVVERMSKNSDQGNPEIGRTCYLLAYRGFRR
jgi:hypothetical protein